MRPSAPDQLTLAAIDAAIEHRRRDAHFMKRLREVHERDAELYARLA